MKASIIQFPHPGGEHDARRKQPNFPWNTGGHQRKYMRAPGTHINTDDKPISGDLVFWGEWEAPSRVTQSWISEPGRPRYLHEPYWHVPTGKDPARQNTDPWVFGECFRYSNCKQLSHKALLNLLPGSLVLFGSSRGGKFLLDTCFVAASSTPLTAPPFVDDAFEVCTTGALEAVAHKLRLHCGATWEKQVHNMFSFAPCLPAGDETRGFQRPEIKLDGLINPKSTRSTRGANVQRPISDVFEAWQSVVSQVRAQGLELGVTFETPPRIETAESPAVAASNAGTRKGC